MFYGESGGWVKIDFIKICKTTIQYNRSRQNFIGKERDGLWDNPMT